jgi:Phosphoribosyl transferase/TRSP domain C terminus to PRTase_2
VSAAPASGRLGLEPAADAADPASWLWTAIGLEPRPPRLAGDWSLADLVGLALRRNPRRAHLLVSRVLGKHLPVRPDVALAAGRRLAALLPADPVAGRPAPLVLGYCETATALGHAVADAVAGSDYLHTTRRPVAGVEPSLSFVEPHSHADLHWLMPAELSLVTEPRPVVLVDDELSTGTTVIGTIRRLHEFAPHPGYRVATLLDARPAASRAAFDALADSLGVPVDVVSLLATELVVPPDAAARAAAVLATHAAGPTADHFTAVAGRGGGDGAGGRSRAAGPDVRRLAPPWPADLPDGGRHGWTPAHAARLAGAAASVADEVATALRRPAGRVLVLGTEELMYVPFRIAAALAERLEPLGGSVVTQSTTRSPVHPLDVDGYAVRSALTFPSPDDVSRPSHVYNVRPGRYDDIVVVTDTPPVRGTAGWDPGPLAAALATAAPVTVVALPSAHPGGAAW